MINILFICHGNICRNHIAEFVMRNLVNQQGLGSMFHIASCATSREEIGNSVHPGTKRKLREVGISCDGKVAVQLTKKDYENYDYLIAMDHNNLRNMKRIIGNDEQGKVSLLLSFAGQDRDIADPWYSGDFEATYRDVLLGCEALVAFLRERGEV